MKTSTHDTTRHSARVLLAGVERFVHAQDLVLAQRQLFRDLS